MQHNAPQCVQAQAHKTPAQAAATSVCQTVMQTTAALTAPGCCYIMLSSIHRQAALSPTLSEQLCMLKPAVYQPWVLLLLHADQPHLLSCYKK
jgi:hypothetical protein